MPSPPLVPSFPTHIPSQRPQTPALDNSSHHIEPNGRPTEAHFAEAIKYSTETLERRLQL